MTTTISNRIPMGMWLQSNGTLVLLQDSREGTVNEWTRSIVSSQSRQTTSCGILESVIPCGDRILTVVRNGMNRCLVVQSRDYNQLARRFWHSEMTGLVSAYPCNGDRRILLTSRDIFTNRETGRVALIDAVTLDDVTPDDLPVALRDVSDVPRFGYMFESESDSVWRFGDDAFSRQAASAGQSPMACIRLQSKRHLMLRYSCGLCCLVGQDRLLEVVSLAHETTHVAPFDSTDEFKEPVGIDAVRKDDSLLVVAAFRLRHSCACVALSWSVSLDGTRIQPQNVPETDSK